MRVVGNAFRDPARRFGTSRVGSGHRPSASVLREIATNVLPILLQEVLQLAEQDRQTQEVADIVRAFRRRDIDKVKALLDARKASARAFRRNGRT